MSWVPALFSSRLSLGLLGWFVLGVWVEHPAAPFGPWADCRVSATTTGSLKLGERWSGDGTSEVSRSDVVPWLLIRTAEMGNGGLRGFAPAGAVLPQLVSEAWCILGGSVCPRDSQAAAVGAGLAGPLGGLLDKASSNNGSLLEPAVLTLWERSGLKVQFLLPGRWPRLCPGERHPHSRAGLSSHLLGSFPVSLRLCCQGPCLPLCGSGELPFLIRQILSPEASSLSALRCFPHEGLGWGVGGIMAFPLCLIGPVCVRGARYLVR